MRYVTAMSYPRRQLVITTKVTTATTVTTTLGIEEGMVGVRDYVKVDFNGDVNG